MSNVLSISQHHKLKRIASLTISLNLSALLGGRFSKIRGSTSRSDFTRIVSVTIMPARFRELITLNSYINLTSSADRSRAVRGAPSRKVRINEKHRADTPRV